MTSQIPVALTIAGFDPSSGAGVTADLAVFTAHKLYGTSAVTTWTVQSTLGVAAALNTPADHFRHTLEHLWADIPAQGIKIGALGNPETAKIVGNFLSGIDPETGLPALPVVFDPVIVSSSGQPLFPPEAVDALHETLLPQVSWVTPNWSELAALTHLPVRNLDDAIAASHALGHRHPRLHVVATGGDQEAPTDLLRTPDGEIHTLPGERISSTSTHGTGCAFSSALLANLMHGKHPASVAVEAAKHYVTEAIRRAVPIGHGRGPLNLSWSIL